MYSTYICVFILVYEVCVLILVYDVRLGGGLVLWGRWPVAHTLGLLSEVLGRCCGGLVPAALALLLCLLPPTLPLLQHLGPKPSNNQTHDKDGAEAAIEEPDHLPI